MGVTFSDSGLFGSKSVPKFGQSRFHHHSPNLIYNLQSKVDPGEHEQNPGNFARDAYQVSLTDPLAKGENSAHAALELEGSPCLNTPLASWKDPTYSWKLIIINGCESFR